MTSSSMSDANGITKILEYQKKALAAIKKSHPHRDEIIKLLNEQVNDDLSQSNAYPCTN